MPALLLAAIGGSGWETGLGYCLRQGMVVRLVVGQGFQEKAKIEKGSYIAFPANHFIAIVFARKSLERWLDDATSKTEDEMKG